MPIQLAFDFWGSTSPETKAAADSDHLQNLRFESIAKMIADRRAPIWSISRLLAGEMAATIKLAKTPVRPFQRPQVDLTTRMKALRELQRTLMEGEALTKRDALDLDGTKFKFVLSEIVRLFERALEDAGTDQFQVESIMVRVDTLLKENDETVRRELNIIGANEMRADNIRASPPVSHGVGLVGGISTAKRLGA